MALRREFSEHIDLAKHGPPAPWPIWRTLLVFALVGLTLAAYLRGVAWIIHLSLEL